MTRDTVVTIKNGRLGVSSPSGSVEVALDRYELEHLGSSMLLAAGTTAMKLASPRTSVLGTLASPDGASTTPKSSAAERVRRIAAKAAKARR